MGEFGDKFRKGREAKELTLDDVSSVTKIGSRMLQAIEEEHFDALPGGVFNKGFIRAYAKHLGLDPEKAVTEYLASQRQAQIDNQQAWQAAAIPAAPPPAAKTPVSGPAKSAFHHQTPVEVEELPELQLPRADDVRAPRRGFTTSTPVRVSWKFAVAAVLLLLVFLLWTRHTRFQHTEAKSSATASPAPTSLAATQVLVAPSPSPTSSARQPGSTASAAATQPSASGDAASDTEEKNDVTVRTFGTPTPKPAPASVGSLALVIRATENSWISVLADGQLVTEETLIAPAHTTIHADREITVKVGNAGGITFLFNGKEISAQGNETEVKTLVFDSAGLKIAPAQTSPNSN